MQNLFSYPLNVDDLSVHEKKFNLTADKNALAYIRDILKVPDVKSFQAEIYVRTERDTRLIIVHGTVEAELELQSVISLENFLKKHTARFEVVFDPAATPQQQKELEVDFAEDLPDIVNGGKIDLADIAIEQLALVMDDYPRKEGEVFSFQPEFNEDEEEKAARNPFNVLKKLKK